MNTAEIFLSEQMTECELHEEIAQKLSFPEYYGKNLDALNDCLSEINECYCNIYLSDNIQNSKVEEIIKIGA